MLRLLRVLSALAALAGAAQAGSFTTASSGNVANASAVAALAAVPGQQWAIQGFEITSGGCTAATVVSATVTGLYGGTMTLTFGCPLGAGVPAVPLVAHFDPPLDAVATHMVVVLTLPALGAGNTNAAVALHGFLR